MFNNKKIIIYKKCNSIKERGLFPRNMRKTLMIIIVKSITSYQILVGIKYSLNQYQYKNNKMINYQKFSKFSNYLPIKNRKNTLGHHKISKRVIRKIVNKILM